MVYHSSVKIQQTWVTRGARQCFDTGNRKLHGRYSSNRTQWPPRRRCPLRKIGYSSLSASILYALSGVSGGHAAFISVNEAFLFGCKLPDAIRAANTDSSVGACTGGNGADTISLQSFVLSSQYPAIESTVTLLGNGNIIPSSLSVENGDLTAQSVTITGGISVSSNSNLTLMNCVISGSTGAGIDAELSDVSVTNCIVTQSSGAGIDALYSDVTVSGSSIKSNSGSGISFVGFAPFSVPSGFVDLKVTESSIEDNSMGGILFSAVSQLDILDSTISGNTGDGVSGSAVTDYFYNYQTYAIYYAYGGVDIRNTTISGNTAAGVDIYSSELSIDNTTVTANEAGADNLGSNLGSNFGLGTPPDTSMTNSIVAGNLVSDVIQSAGTSVTSSGNLFGDNSKATAQSIIGNFLSNTDITATSDGTVPTALPSILDISLADNGGSTDTHALVSGSPAIDALATGQPADQRGVERPLGAGYDIGAYEFEPQAIALCNGLTITVDLNLGQSTTPNDDVVLGTSGPDDIRGKAGNDTICGMGGDDFIHGNSGDDWIDGGDGVDNLRGGQGNDVVNTGSGSTVGHPSRAFGGKGDDEINGGADNDDLRGGRGVDTIKGFGGDDVITGNEDNDIVNGGTGFDTVKGGNGNDDLRGGADDDVVNGGAGDDELNGGAGSADFCDGGNGTGDTATASCEIVANVP